MSVIAIFHQSSVVRRSPRVCNSPPDGRECVPMNRPKGLTLTAILMAVCAAAPSVIFLRPWRSTAFIAIVILVTGIAYFMVWAYWKGRNWARICVLIVSATSILSLTTWNTSARHQHQEHTLPIMAIQVVLAGRAVLGAFLLYYLNTRSIRDFFHQPNEQALSNTPNISTSTSA